MNKLMAAVALSAMMLQPACSSAQNATNSDSPKTVTVKNPWMWTDTPDPDIIRVGDYYYLVTTTMHMTPGGPIMRSKDLVNWETISYLFDEIHDTPRYDLEQGTVYGRGQWATSIRYHKGTFWALFVANDDPHKSMVFKTDDPAKGWKLHSRLPAYHDSSLFFDDDDRVYVFSGSGDITLVELNSDLTAEKPGGVHKKLELHGRPQGLHEGSRVIKHDGMYYLLCIAWPNTGRCEIAYRSRNIEGPYESKVIVKSEFGGFPFVGQGTIVDGKHGEWYGVIFQDRAGVGRVLTLSPCTWVDGWPMIGEVIREQGKGIDNYRYTARVPETMTLETEDDIEYTGKYGQQMKLEGGVTMTKDYQFNHNPLKEAYTKNGNTYTFRSTKTYDNMFLARNTLTWRMWAPTCSDTVRIDASKLKDGDRAGFCVFSDNAGMMSVVREGGKYFLVLTNEVCELDPRNKAVTDVKVTELGRVAIPKSKIKNIQIAIDGNFVPRTDIANFRYSLDGKQWKQLGGDFKMTFNWQKFFMGCRYGVYYYATKITGGQVNISSRTF